MSILTIMDHSGHRTLTFEKGTTEHQTAEQVFRNLMDTQNYAALKNPEAESVLVDTLDPDADETVLIARIVGG